MKKTAIFTIISNNYGNRLQNYALQSTINRLGRECVTLQGRPEKKRIDDIVTSYKIPDKCRWIILIYIRIKKLFNRDNSFEIFNTNYINGTDEYISINRISLEIDNYDAYVAGSDQIWNTNFNFVSVNSFLPFAHEKKIAYAASFGVDSIPYDSKIVDCLNDFKALSVREEAGARIIKEFTGRNAVVLVDPTMLLTQEEWRNIAKKPKGANEYYILTYFLSPKCQEARERLDDVKGDKTVYELLNPNDSIVGTAGPSEFLWLFDHADLILTDSFHACVFSFLFNKPFLVYDRNWEGSNMNSRLKTFLSKFSLERKYSNSGLKNDIWEHDYEEGFKQLGIERKKAMDFLKEAFAD